MKTINRVTVHWDVSAADLKHLRGVSKSWGHRTVSAYLRSVIEMKIGGSPVGCASRAEKRGVKL